MVKAGLAWELAGTDQALLNVGFPGAGPTPEVYG